MDCYWRKWYIICLSEFIQVFLLPENVTNFDKCSIIFGKWGIFIVYKKLLYIIMYYIWNLYILFAYFFLLVLAQAENGILNFSTSFVFLTISFYNSDSFLFLYFNSIFFTWRFMTHISNVFIIYLILSTKWLFSYLLWFKSW